MYIYIYTRTYIHMFILDTICITYIGCLWFRTGIAT